MDANNSEHEKARVKTETCGCARSLSDASQSETVMRDVAFRGVIDAANVFLGTMPTQGFCVYCGDYATDWDHVVPHSFLTTCERRSYSSGVLPSCHWCNAHLSNGIFETLDERLHFVSGRFFSKHRKILSAPDWTEREIAELGPNLRSGVRQMAIEKQYLRARGVYLGRGVFDLWSLVYAQHGPAIKS